MAKMTLDETGRKYLMEIGLEPVGNRAILVEYAPIRLLSPKKGVGAFMGATGRWHINNMDDTLQMLKSLQANVAGGIN